MLDRLLLILYFTYLGSVFYLVSPIAPTIDTGWVYPVALAPYVLFVYVGILFRVYIEHEKHLPKVLFTINDTLKIHINKPFFPIITVYLVLEITLTIRGIFCNYRGFDHFIF